MKYRLKRLRAKSNRNTLSAALVFGAVGSLIIGLSFANPADDGFTNVINNPIDPNNLLSLQYYNRSDYIQPWRAYMDTVPASTLVDAVGINMNVPDKQFDATARVLAANGFKRARIEFGWGGMDYDDPTKMSAVSQQRLQQYVSTLKKYGIRPLILLNAHSGQPVPTKTFPITLTQAAKKDDRTIKIDPAQVPLISPNYIGLHGTPNTWADKIAAFYRFMSVTPDGTVTLSRPLMADLPAGQQTAESQRFHPFYPPTKADGQPSQDFKQTMDGWLAYTGAVTKAAKQAYGSDNFDVEIWNELSFGSAFIAPTTYYQPMPAGYGNEDASHPVMNAILAGTVAYIRNPANGVSNIGIGNGFSNEHDGWTGQTAPVGLTAMDKHLYSGVVTRSGDGAVGTLIDATGGKDPTFLIGCYKLGNPIQTAPYTDTNKNGKYDQGEPCTAKAGFYSTKEPAYNAFLPEAWLADIRGHSVTRDLAPIANALGRDPNCTPSNPPSFNDTCKNIHGRYARPCPTCAPLQIWITEVNLKPKTGVYADPANPDFKEWATMNNEEASHVADKIYLRYLTAFVNKGASAIDFYAATSGDYALVNKSFFDQLTANAKNPSFYPGDNAGGPHLTTIRNLTDIMKQGAAPITAPRQLALTRIADNHNHKQFEKTDDTPNHPPLYNRDVLAILPFQVSNTRFAIPSYVMTRNVARVYQPKAPTTAGQRFDLPQEAYRITLTGFNPAKAYTASAIDPLTNLATPVSIVSQSGGTIVVQTELTDSPRVIVLDESGGTTPPPPPPDTIPPDTAVVTSTPDITTATGAAFTFTSSESSPTFECKLDSAAFAPCNSPKSYTGLAVGSHTFSVRAKDVAGNQDASPATYTWTVNAPDNPPPPVTPPATKKGDITGPSGKPDGKIDIFDLSFIIRKYNTNDAGGDITGPTNNPDSKIDIFDLSFIIRNYGK